MAKNKYKKKSGSIRVWVSLGLVLVFGASSFICIRAYQWLIEAPFLNVGTIVVEGAKKVMPLEVVALAGISPHTNILAIDQARICRRVASHNWIREAHVTRVIPDKVIITIEERDAIALVEHGELFLMDSDGSLFEPAGERAEWPLPVISGLGPQEVRDARVVEPFLALALHVLGLIEQRGFESAQVDYSLANGFSIVPLGARFRIWLGFSEFNLKLARLTRVTDFLKSQGVLDQVKCIDLKFGNRVFVSGDFMETFRKET